jgi:hypothetical protein
MAQPIEDRSAIIELVAVNTREGYEKRCHVAQGMVAGLSTREAHGCAAYWVDVAGRAAREGGEFTVSDILAAAQSIAAYYVRHVGEF